MNPHIEVIAPDLWGVNMSWVRVGYIAELKSLSDAKDQINLTNAGVIVLDKDSKVYPGLKKFFAKAVQLSDAELQAEFQRAEVAHENGCRG